ncbi:MAG: hypothetical protein KBH82_12485 [Syntrophorhabdaceae bacterium]|nr:hypothetical protein [Syntrophorhabdaceae bacterium]
MALKEAVAEALAEHKRRGQPIAVWRNNKAVLIPPEEIVIPEFDILIKKPNKLPRRYLFPKI